MIPEFDPGDDVRGEHLAGRDLQRGGRLSARGATDVVAALAAAASQEDTLPTVK